MTASAFCTITRGIRVTVDPRYLPAESAPDEDRYLFAYTVEIANLGTETVQLLSRYWRIVDGEGRLQEVRGAGVVGQEPVIAPGEAFTYTSGCPLGTPHGTMEGHYTMTILGGESFEARIPAFPLESPLVRRVVH